MYAVIVANPTIDIVITREGRAKRVGGPPYYMGLALSALGIRAEAVGVVGPDEYDVIAGELEKIGVRPRLKIGDATAYFELDYNSKPRRSKALRRPSVKIEGLVEAPLVLVNPVFDEVGDLRFFADLSAVDLQGFLRSGTAPPEADIVHFSDDDMAVDPGKLGEYNEKWNIVLYTQGAAGAYMSTEGRLYFVESAGIEAEDTTGSGDIFLAAFAAVMMRRGDAVEALCEASKYVAGYLRYRALKKIEYDCSVRLIA